MSDNDLRDLAWCVVGVVLLAVWLYRRFNRPKE